MEEKAVSEVVGEMLMLGLVLLLVAIFAATAFNLFIPTGRDPQVTVMLANGTDWFSLHHKGGDWVRATDLSVIVQNGTGSERFRAADPEWSLDPAKQTFDLGSSLKIAYPLESGDEVRLVTHRAVLFSGRFP